MESLPFLMWTHSPCVVTGSRVRVRLTAARRQAVAPSAPRAVATTATRTYEAVARMERRSRIMGASRLAGAAACRNVPELHLVLHQERHCDAVVLAVDPDVCGTAVRLRHGHRVSVVQHEQARVGPARHQKPPVGERLDAVLLARAGADRFGHLLPGRPLLDRFPADRDNDE